MRRNTGGELRVPFYGRLAAVAVDPIEKKPLYHFWPGSTILSVGSPGCNFRCPWCQNSRISQSSDVQTREVSPAELAEMAPQQGSIGVAYTYTEPLIHAEYVVESAARVRQAGLQNVLVTAGYANPEAAREILAACDAANVDLKAWDPDVYRSHVGGELEAVMEFLRLAAELVHLEVTTLVIPGVNDDPAQIDGAAAFLAGLSPDIPYHLSCYFPAHRFTAPPTPRATVEALAHAARRHLRYVYLGNAAGRSDTLCPDCGTVLVRRTGYGAVRAGLVGDRCAGCSRRIPIIGKS